VANIIKLPPEAAWSVSAILLAIAVWLLIKWRAQHSRILKPEALRLDRDNPEHLVGRVDDIEILFQQCLAKPIIFLEGESGSGKSALVRAGLLPRLIRETRSCPSCSANFGWTSGSVEHSRHCGWRSLRTRLLHQMSKTRPP